MQRSSDRILTTHTGSLPRPPELVQMMYDLEEGTAVDQARLREAVSQATAEVVRKQLAAGVDLINDGEASKVSYATYVKDRLTGFEGPPLRMENATARDFPDFYAEFLTSRNWRPARSPSCSGPVAQRNVDAVQEDIATFKAALRGSTPAGTFMTAASPGVITIFHGNSYYPSFEAYLGALADAMQPEYEAIAAAGFVLQVDCPDLAMSRPLGENADMPLEQFRSKLRLQVEALNHALRNVPEEQVRIHVCWGNLPQPHTRDVPVKDILDILFTVKASAISFEGANPRHEHEWQVFEDVKLPDGKVIIPGVLDSTTNYVEHPELVAQRIARYAKLVGRENVIAGSDCGFATFAGHSFVHPSVTWAKLAAMAEGARMASAQLW